LWARPEFKILWSVVILDAVAVMNALVRRQVAAEQLFGDKDVFEDVVA